MLVLMVVVVCLTWALRRVFSNVLFRAGISYLFVGGLAVALPLFITNPASSFWGWLWLTLTWPFWLVFGLDSIPSVVLPYLFTFS